MGARELTALSRLEELVERAAEQIEAHRAENRELRERLQKLESADGEQASWEGDRAQLIERVEKLVGGLDEVLALSESD